jgi:erythrin-vacuolar iron transport family protein
VKSFEELSEREILALAIASEEDDNRVYMTFAENLHDSYPSTAKVFEEMATVEAGHRQMLTELYQECFGPHILPIRRGDLKLPEGGQPRAGPGRSQALARSCSDRTNA